MLRRASLQLALPIAATLGAYALPAKAACDIPIPTPQSGETCVQGNKSLTVIALDSFGDGTLITYRIRLEGGGIIAFGTIYDAQEQLVVVQGGRPCDGATDFAVPIDDNFGLARACFPSVPLVGGFIRVDVQ